jgi:hypothetical protein
VSKKQRQEQLEEVRRKVAWFLSHQVDTSYPGDGVLDYILSEEGELMIQTVRVMTRAAAVPDIIDVTRN